jgi:putative CocE/NonD family hydrolase
MPRNTRTRLRSRFFRFAKWALLSLLVVAALLAGTWFLFPRAIQSGLAKVVENLLPRYLAWRSGTGWFEVGLPSKSEVKVAMRDGGRLATDLYLPDNRGRFPVILVRTPYNKAEGRVIGEFFGRYGYAVAVQDVRGRHASEGEFYPFRSEVADGVDMTRWARQQPWCNGRIGAFGLSYLGFTQWAMAVGNPELSSFAPIFISSDLYRGIYGEGAFGKLTFLHWSLTSYGRYGDWGGARNIRKGYDHFPLVDSDDVALQDIPFYNDWVAHPVPDEYWRAMSVAHRFSEISAPAFLVAGWYDFFLDAQLRDFQAIRGSGDPRVREASRILIGPWSHGFFNGHQERYGIRQRTLEAIPFDFVREMKDWYDYSLKGIDNGWGTKAPVRIYVLGDNEWRDEREWPPARVSQRPYYLGSVRGANSLGGDGVLDEGQPAESARQDSFVYDPRNPVPTRGGAHGVPAEIGPADQRSVEGRQDVLVYTGRPLAEPVLVMGTVKVRLYASSTAPDTDFTAKLVDVFPDGRALIVCEGIVRARYRNGFDKPERLQPGAVCPFDIKVGDTAVRFQTGHRIRLEISSSNFPRYDANPNTGGDIATECDPVPATQKVFHGRAHPSALILPVIP